MELPDPLSRRSHRARRLGMRGRLLAGAGLAGTSIASMVLADALDRRRIKADPAWERLQVVPAGRQRTVTGAGGVQLYVEDYGPEDAPPVVLVHGWVCCLRFWRLQVADLMRDHHVIAYDLRGHGDSGSTDDGDWSLETLADDLEAVLDAYVGDDRRALLAGHSLGAMTIAAWAGRHERRAGAVAMINTGLGDLITEALVFRAPDAFSRPRKLLGGVILGAGLPLPKRPSPISHRAVRAIALSSSASPAAVRYSEEMVLQTKPLVRAGCGRELSQLNLLDRVEHLTAPTLVIAGGRDKLTPATHAHRLAEALPDCTGLVEIEDSGHMSPLEHDEEVSAALRELAAAHLTAPVRAS